MSEYVVINPRKIPKGIRIFVEAGRDYFEGDDYAGTSAKMWLERGMIKKGGSRGKNFGTRG